LDIRTVFIVLLSENSRAVEGIIAMAWLSVIVGGLFETLFAVCLKASDGFTKFWPTVGFVVSVSISMGLLGLGLKSLPVGTAYAVWVGIGAVGTAVVGMLYLGDPMSLMRITAIALIVGGVVMLNLSGGSVH
jgi:quaternary ammonium compound-resistance protein SugE